MKLNLGCGVRPIGGYINHDKTNHSHFVDQVWDLEVLPWPWGGEAIEHIKAFDVFEHLRPWKLGVEDWMGECWRILRFGGLLEMRLPASDHPNHYGFRDPTHCRLFTHESMDYFCPEEPSRLHEEFGFYYFGENYGRWWKKESVTRDSWDWLFRLRKI